MTFKDENLPLQELAREWSVLRKHNLRFKEGDPKDTLLMFAEAAIVCMTLEHFARVVVGSHLPEDAQLYNLLQKGVSLNLFRVPWDDQQDGIKKICDVRNNLLHGNFAKAARNAGCSSVAAYFKTQYAGELESMTKITDYIIAQIDAETGKPR